MTKPTEEHFKEGKSTKEVVRINNTVHRTTTSNSSFTQKLLTLLEEKGYPYSPKFLGIDNKGREILTYIEGDIARGDIKWSDENLIKITKMLKEFHDATEESDLAGDKEIVCHNDLAPWNTILLNNKPIAFIDFNDCTPGYRVEDFAYFLWTFLNLGDNTSVQTQIKRIKLLSEEYGGFNSSVLMDAILNQQKRILEKRKYLSQNAETQEERDFSQEKIIDIRKDIEWVKKNRGIIEEIF